MKEYYIDFSGYVKVKAESEEDATEKFWALFVSNCVKPFSDDVWDIDGVEEIGKETKIFTNPNMPNLSELEDFWQDK